MTRRPIGFFRNFDSISFSFPGGSRVGQGRLRHRVRGREEQRRDAGGHQAHRQGQDQGLGSGKKDEGQRHIYSSNLSVDTLEGKKCERSGATPIKEYTFNQYQVHCGTQYEYIPKVRVRVQYGTERIEIISQEHYVHLAKHRCFFPPQTSFSDARFDIHRCQASQCSTLLLSRYT